MCGVYTCPSSYTRADAVCWVGLKVVNVSAFEKHAGSSARHPSDFIFLENGKCLKDIIEIGMSANKQKVNIMEVLKSAIGEVGGKTIKISQSLIQNELVEKKPRLSLDTKPRLPLDTKPRLSLDAKPRMPLDTKPRPASELKVRGNEGRAALPRFVCKNSVDCVSGRGHLYTPEGVGDRHLMWFTQTGRCLRQLWSSGIIEFACYCRDRTIKEKEPASSPVISRETSGANLHKALFLPGGLEDGTELGYYVKGQV